MQWDQTRMKEDYDDLFSGLGKVKNITYYIDVNEEAVFDHKIARPTPHLMKEIREENEHDDRRKRTRRRIHSA
jgi:hypothetical protein